MAQETESLMETISSMLSMSRIKCNSCSFSYYGNATYNEQSGKTVIRGICPKCGSRDLSLVGE